MIRKIFGLSVIAYLILLPIILAEAKTANLQEVEGDRVVVLSIDRKAKISKNFLSGKVAWDYLGSMEGLKNRVTQNLYTGENVIRHSSSPRYQNISDGVIFNAEGRKIGYVHRRDGAFTVIIDYPAGRKLKVVDEALFDNYANVINDDCTNPYVFFDNEGREAAIVFLPRSMFVYQYITKEGWVALEVKEQI